MKIEVGNWVFDMTGEGLLACGHWTGEINKDTGDNNEGKTLHIVGQVGETVYAIGGHNELYEKTTNVIPIPFSRSAPIWAKGVGFPDWDDELDVLRWATAQALKIEVAFSRVPS